MNRQALIDLAKAIEDNAVEGMAFNMCVYKYSIGDDTGDGKVFLKTLDRFLKKNHCNTAGCIAGWAVALNAKKASVNVEEVQSAATDLLGLSRNEASKLFLGDMYNMHDITREHAISCLRYTAIRNKVSWKWAEDHRLNHKDAQNRLNEALKKEKEDG